jgi:DNA repair protein RadD
MRHISAIAANGMGLCGRVSRPEREPAEAGSGGLREVMLFNESRPAINPRPYQVNAFNAVKTFLEYREGNPCVVLPTGAGKTILIVLLCQWVASWGGRVLILAHVRELLQQAADKLNAMSPELHVGVYSAGLDRREKSGQITIAGIQSVYQRAGEFEPFDLVIVDEAHLIPADGEGMYRTFLRDLRKYNTKLRTVGLTATPYRMTTGPLCGPDEMLNAICFDVSVMELIDQGYLSKLVSKRVAECDTSKLHIRAGEFVADEVAMLMGGPDAVRSACEKIIERTQDRKSVLVFCAGVQHAEDVAKLLPDAEVITGETKERGQIIGRFQRSELKYLVNVNVLTTGFDAPNVDCVVLLRPTMSPGLYYQMVGRGFRLCEGKADCLVLDFGGNIQRHGPVNRIRVEKKTRGKPNGEAATKVCPDCDEVFYVGVKVCTECGYVWPSNQNFITGHGVDADDVDVISDEVEELPVYEVKFSKHFKKNGTPDDPPTLRVDYITTQGGLVSRWQRGAVVSEWVCIEHSGFALTKAKLWWQARSNDPMPTTVDRAIDIAEGGGLANVEKIWIAPDEKNPKYTRIIRVQIGEKPEAAELCSFCGGTGCDECRFDFDEVTAEAETETVVDWGDIPF